MASAKKSNVQGCFDNKWYPEFVDFRNIRDDTTLVNIEKKINAAGNDLGISYMFSENTASPCEVEVLDKFCRAASLEDVRLGRGIAGNRRTVWLDDRSSRKLEGSGEARQYDNPLTATGLFRALAKQRFNHEKLTDATRRLMHFVDIDPTCIHALAATATPEQTSMLKNAIYKHLAFQPSIAVTIPTSRLLRFQLDLHLPVFILSNYAPGDEARGTINTKPQRRWIDLSFLKLGGSYLEGKDTKEVWGLCEAHISCIVTGWDEWRWIAYGFGDSILDGLLSDSETDDISTDPISAGILRTNDPIWRPRDYWLRVSEIRIEQAREHWEHVIYKVELSINQYVSHDISIFNPFPGI